MSYPGAQGQGLGPGPQQGSRPHSFAHPSHPPHGSGMSGGGHMTMGQQGGPTTVTPISMEAMRAQLALTLQQQRGGGAPQVGVNTPSPGISFHPFVHPLKPHLLIYPFIHSLIHPLSYPLSYTLYHPLSHYLLTPTHFNNRISQGGGAGGGGGGRGYGGGGGGNPSGRR